MLRHSWTTLGLHKRNTDPNAWESESGVRGQELNLKKSLASFRRLRPTAAHSRRLGSFVDLVFVSPEKGRDGESF